MTPTTDTFGPAAFLAKLEDDAPERARQIIDRVWLGKGNLTQGEAEWLDSKAPGEAWPAQKALEIASRDGNPVPRIAAKYVAP
jgi:hypothetical protein